MLDFKQIQVLIDQKKKISLYNLLEERRIQLEAVKYIDEIIIYDTEKELHALLQKIMPNIRILGSDYISKSFTGDDLNIYLLSSELIITPLKFKRTHKKKVKINIIKKSNY